jgi:hypothetical protein
MAYTFVFHAEAIITCKKISLSFPIFLSLGSLISLYEHTHEHRRGGRRSPTAAPPRRKTLTDPRTKLLNPNPTPKIQNSLPNRLDRSFLFGLFSSSFFRFLLFSVSVSDFCFVCVYVLKFVRIMW